MNEAKQRKLVTEEHGGALSSRVEILRDRLDLRGGWSSRELDLDLPPVLPPSSSDDFPSRSSPHEAGVVNFVASSVVLICVDLHGVLGELQQRVHPLAVLVNVQEGEMQRQAPGREKDKHHEVTGVDLFGELAEEDVLGRVGQNEHDVHVSRSQLHQVAH
ncbi:hypothetical protein INR49_022236, partial [Caranx melampygus]